MAGRLTNSPWRPLASGIRKLLKKRSRVFEILAGLAESRVSFSRDRVIDERRGSCTGQIRAARMGFMNFRVCQGTRYVSRVRAGTSRFNSPFRGRKLHVATRTPRANAGNRTAERDDATRLLVLTAPPVKVARCLA